MAYRIQLRLAAQIKPQNSEPLIRVLPGFDSGRENTLRQTLDSIRQSTKCAEAFARAGLETVAGLITHGIVIGPATLLLDSYNNQQAGISEDSADMLAS